MTGLCYVSGGRLYDGNGNPLALRGVNDSWSLCGLIAARGGNYTPGVDTDATACVQYSQAINSSSAAEVAQFYYRMAKTLQAMSPSINFVRIGAHSCEGTQALYCTWRYDVANGTSHHDRVMTAMAQGFEAAGMYFQVTCSGFSDQNAAPGNAQNRRLLTTMTGTSDYVNSSNVGYSTDNILYTGSTSFNNFAAYVAHVCDVVGKFPHCVAVEIANEPDLHLYKDLFWSTRGSSWAKGGDRETAFKNWISSMVSAVKAARTQPCLLTNGCTPFDGPPYWQGVQWWSSGTDWADMQATVANLSEGLDIAGIHMYHFSPEFCTSYNGSATSYSCSSTSGAVPQVWCSWNTISSNLESYFRTTEGQPICVNEWGKYCNAWQEWVQTQATSMETYGVHHACILPPGGRPLLDVSYTIPSGWSSLPGTGGTSGGGGTGTTTATTLTVTADVPTVSNPLYGLNMGKLFHINGRYYQFYSDGSNTYYKTSADLVTWSSATLAAAGGTTPSYTGVMADPANNKIHLVRTSNTSTIYYRRGTPNSSGVISWDFAEVNIYSNCGGTSVVFRSIDICSDGDVLISYTRDSNPWVLRFTYTTSVQVDSGYPVQVSSAGTSQRGYVVALSDGWYCAYAVNSAAIKGKKYTNGSGLGSEETATLGSITTAHLFTLTADSSDNVHLTYNKYVSSSDWRAMYRKRSSSGTWDSSEYDVGGAAVTSTTLPYITTRTNGDQFVWIGNGTTKVISYRGHSSSGSWDSSLTTVVTESSAGLASTDGWQYASESQFNGHIALGYSTDSASPYTIKLAYLTFGSTGGGTGTTTVVDSTTITTSVTTASTTTSGSALKYPMAEHVTTAQNYIWVFYCNGSNNGWQCVPLDAIDVDSAITITTRTPDSISYEYYIDKSGVVKNSSGTQVYPSAGTTTSFVNCMVWAQSNLSSDSNWIKIGPGDFAITAALRIYRNVQGSGNYGSNKTRLYAATGSVSPSLITFCTSSPSPSSLLSNKTFSDVELDGMKSSYPYSYSSTNKFGGLQLKWCYQCTCKNMYIHDWPYSHGISLQAGSYNNISYVDVQYIGDPTRQGAYGNGICSGTMYMSDYSTNYATHHNTVSHCTAYGCSMVGFNWEDGYYNTTSYCTSLCIYDQFIDADKTKPARAVTNGPTRATYNNNNSYDHCFFAGPGCLAASKGENSSWSYCTFYCTKDRSIESSQACIECNTSGAQSIDHCIFRTYSTSTKAAVGIKFYGVAGCTANANTVYAGGTTGVGYGIWSNGNNTTITNNVVNNMAGIYQVSGTGNTISGNSSGTATYSSSVWSSFTSLGDGATSGIGFTIVNDGDSDIYYFRGNAASSANTKYRKGTLGTGTITWSAEDSCEPGGTSNTIQSAAKGTDGSIMYSFLRDGYVYVGKMSSPGTTWTNDSGFPLGIQTTTNSTDWRSQVVALPNGDYYVAYAKTGSQLYGKVVSGSSAGTEQTFSSTRPVGHDTDTGHLFNIAADSTGIVHAAWNYWDSVAGYRLYYNRRLADGTMSTETAIENGVQYATAPHLAVDQYDQCFMLWADTPIGGNIYYSLIINGARDPETNGYADSGSDIAYGNLGSMMHKAHGERLVYAFLDGTSSPYTVKAFKITLQSVTSEHATPTTSSGTHIDAGSYFMAYLKVLT